jgi:large subunit ribosomal protein L7/L12
MAEEEKKEEVQAEPAKEITEEAVVPEKTETKSEPTGKFADLIKQIETLSVADLADLVKELEDRFGVSAAAPMAVAAGGAASGGAQEEAEEKSSYTVVLANSGEQKIAVIKAVREINQNLGLKEAKDLVDAAPKELLKDVSKEDAEVAKQKLEAAGATVEMR